MKARVLLVHNHYRSSEPSGEAQVLEAESEMLRSHGHELREFFRSSDEILSEGIQGTLKGALSTPWNPFSARAVQREIDAFSPDVVHIHNTFPLLSPAIFHAIGSRAARILTLHNYRLFCSAAIPMRDGSICTECLEQHSVWPALKYGCYRNSRIATVPLAVSVSLHRRLRTWIDEVDAFIVLTEFQRELMVEGGLPEKLVHVKPNFLPSAPDVLAWAVRRPTVLFAGRLSAEKGVENLIRAWTMWGPTAPELRIIGDGPLRGELEELAGLESQIPIRFLGQLSNTVALEEIAQSSLVVLPSIGLETFGLVILEAFASGTPVAVSQMGPLSSIVRQGENGLLFFPGDAQSLLEIVKSAWESEGKLEQLGSGARRSFDERYSEQMNYELMMEIYQQALEVSRARKTK